MLSIGEINPSAVISIRSFLALKPVNKVCLGVNKLSTTLLSTSLTIEEYGQLCLHDLSRDFRTHAKLELDNFSKYQQYHSRNFAEITLGKWLLIKHVFREHSSNYILFSDLDVFWKKQENLRIRIASGVQILTQDGWYPSKGDWFCTGIMFWERTEQTQNILDTLMETQIASIEKGKSNNDEIIFNNLFLNTNRIHQTSTLPRYEFLVGYHVLNLRFINTRKLLNRCLAFHANSVEGENLKLQLLRTAISSEGSLATYLPQHLKLLYKIASKKLFRFKIAKFTVKVTDFKN